MRWIILLMSLALALSKSAIADDPGRVAIVDSSESTKAHLSALKKAGVLVIGRYMGRCHQWAGKRMIDNKAELSAILDAGLAVLSIYQYDSGNPLKFSGVAEKRTYLKSYPDTEDGKKAQAARDAECPLGDWPSSAMEKEKHVVELGERDKDCKEVVVRHCAASTKLHSGIEEAQMDVDAALAQAHEIDQPAGTAIYFGVDFDVVLKEDRTLRQALIDYFTVVSNALRADPRHYLIGAYGNGAALELVVNTKIQEGPFKGRPLADLTWFNASPGHDRTGEVYNGGEKVDTDARFDWDLFQSRVAVNYPTANGLSVDLDIQNKKNAQKYIGFWKRGGPYKVPEARTAAIFDQRRFACNGKTIVRSAPGGDGIEGLYCGRQTDDEARTPIYDCNKDGFFPGDKRARICFGSLTRVRVVPGSNFIQVDCDEDGSFDGFTAAANLGKTMAKRPIWIDDNDKRREATRDQTACDR